MTDIYAIEVEGEPMLVTPLGPGADLGAVWEELEALRASGWEMCSVCHKAVAKDERGDVLDSSGRCDECRP